MKKIKIFLISFALMFYSKITFATEKIINNSQTQIKNTIKDKNILYFKNGEILNLDFEEDEIKNLEKYILENFNKKLIKDTFGFKKKLY